MKELHDKMRAALDRYEQTGEFQRSELEEIKCLIDQPADRMDYMKWIHLWNRHADKSVRITDKKRKQIRARLKVFTEQEVEQAIIGRFEDDWVNGPGINHRDNWEAIWRSDDKMEHWLIKSGNHPSQKREPAPELDMSHPLQVWIRDKGLHHLMELEWLTPEECEILVSQYGKEDIAEAAEAAHFLKTPAESAYVAIASLAMEATHV